MSYYAYPVNMHALSLLKVTKSVYLFRRAAEGGRTLGGGGGGAGAKHGTILTIANEGDQVYIKCTDASNKRDPVT